MKLSAVHWAFKTLIVLVCLLLLLVVTPLGPHLVAFVGVRLAAAYDWQVEIAERGGTLVGACRFSGVQVRGPQGDLQLEAAGVQVSLWP